MPKTYPRPTFRRVIKAHLDEAAAQGKENDGGKAAALSRDVDVVAYLAYLSFLQRLAREARAEAFATTASAPSSSTKVKVTVGRRQLRKAAKRAEAQMRLQRDAL